MQDRTCIQDNCEAPANGARGMCCKHYNRWRRHGDANHVTVQANTPAEAVAATVDHIDPNGCWIAKQSRIHPTTGYATAHIRGRGVLAHRLSYEAHIAPIPAGLQIDHLCRVRHCVNPAHLEAVTVRTNLLRSPLTRATINASRTHCPAGHPYTDENTYRTAEGRACRTCTLDRARVRYAARKASAA